DDVGKAIDLQRWAVDDQGRPVGQINLGPKVGVSELDLALGPMQETANPLDLAIAGTGFFAVQAPDGQTRYSRDGGFSRDNNGTLVNRMGAPVLDEGGQPITLPEGDVGVAADGTILVNGQQAAKLQIVDFPAGQQLIKVGNGMFEANGGQPQ